MAVSGKSEPFKRSWFVGLSLLALALVLAVGALLWQVVELTSLVIVSERIADIKPVVGGVRLLLIGLLALFWLRLVDFAARARNVDERIRVHWLALRWRISGWLLVIELMLGQDLLGRFLGTILGMAP